MKKIQKINITLFAIVIIIIGMFTFPIGQKFKQDLFNVIAFDILFIMIPAFVGAMILAMDTLTPGGMGKNIERSVAIFIAPVSLLGIGKLLSDIFFRLTY